VDLSTKNCIHAEISFVFPFHFKIPEKAILQDSLNWTRQPNDTCHASTIVTTCEITKALRFHNNFFAMASCRDS